MNADPLLQPYQLKHLTLRNRIMSTSHEPSYSEDGMPKDRYRLYHVEKAKGGVALTMTAGSAVVSPDSPQAFGNLLAYKDEIVPWLKRLADECHDHGAAVMIQITHMGRRTNWAQADWLPVLAPSPIREPAHRSFPKQAEDWDLERVIRDYAAAAQRMEAAGLDGLEIDAYGHLLDQFWSPATNKRDDQYGGDLEGRTRLSFRVLEAIRKAVSPKFLVGVRMTADEDWDIGLTKADGVAIAQRLAGSGLVDFLNIIRGHIETDQALSKVIPIQGTPAAPHLEFAGELRAATKFPVFHASRIQDVATARYAISAGKLDMVGMTRAHIADPHIARKVMEGREEDIRPCVGATYCLDRIYEGKEALCIHNPATGREATMPHIIQPSKGPKKKVVVIGAGPGGLEAARVSAERGHEVVLFEASDKVGGQVLLASRQPRRKELIGLIDWRAAQLEKLGVQLRFGVWAEAADVLDEAPDVVFVATGGLPNTENIEFGADLVNSSWDVLSGDAKPAETALVYDDNSSHPALAAAEMLAEGGAQVEIVSPERFFAVDIGGLNHAAYAEVFHRHHVRITISTRLVGVRRDGNKLVATLGSDYGPERVERRVDQVIVENGTLPLADLYEALRPGSVNLGEVDHQALLGGAPQTLETNPEGRYRLFRIGDAVTSRNIHAAIYDALRLAKDL